MASLKMIEQLTSGPDLALELSLVEHLQQGLIGWQFRKRRPPAPFGEGAESLRAAHAKLIQTN